MDLLKRITGGDKDASQGSEAAKAPAVEPLHLNAEEFDAQVSGSELPVVVDFWAEWCGPCHAIAPSVAKMAQEYNGRAVVAKVNADDHPEILMRYGIMGIPTLIYFKGGQEVDRVVGLNPYGTLKTKLERLLA
jgi:thioredoxin 1